MKNNYQAVNIVSVTAMPFITNDGFQKSIVTLSSKKKDAIIQAKITVGSNEPYTVYLDRISFGISRQSINITDTNGMLKPGETTVLKIELFETDDYTGTPISVYKDNNWQRSRHWQFYISQTMHTDLGYTDYAETLPALYSSFIDTAKKYIKDSHNRAEDKENYKYAIESSWVLSEGYAKEKNADELEELVDLVKSGDFAVAAGRFNNAMENSGTEEIARLPYLTNKNLKDRYGLPSDNTIRMFDNPAISKSYITALNSATNMTIMLLQLMLRITNKKAKA